MKEKMTDSYTIQPYPPALLLLFVFFFSFLSYYCHLFLLLRRVGRFAVNQETNKRRQKGKQTAPDTRPNDRKVTRTHDGTLVTLVREYTCLRDLPLSPIRSLLSLCWSVSELIDSPQSNVG